MDDTAKLVAIILLSAFAIERIVAAIGYCIDAMALSRSNADDAAEQRARQKRKIALVTIAGAIAVAVVWVADLRILRVLRLTQAPPAIDFALTWLVLFAGADRIRDFLQTKSGGGTPASVRIHVDNDAQVREIPRAS